jgi:carboxyl-terminal processing protease
MRCLLFLVPLLCLAQGAADENSFSKLLRQTKAQAEQLYRQKEYGKAAALLDGLRRNPALARLEEDERLGVSYDLACNYSLAGEKEKAIGALREVVAAGYADASHLRQDSDLDPIRQEPEYKKLYAEVETRYKAQQAFWNSASLRTAYREELPEDEKIAGLSRLWSEAKYNFAFFDRLPSLDWDALYLSYLPKVRAATTTLEYYDILAEFYAQLHDGHTGVNYPRQLGALFGYPPVSTKLVEDRVFIDIVQDPSLKDQGIVRGLEVMAIDGIPVKEYGKTRIAPHVGASTQQDLEVRTYEARLLGGRKDVPVRLTLADAAGQTFEKVLPRPTQAERAKLPRAPWRRFDFRMLPGDVAYVALNTFGDDGVVKDFDAAYAEIEKSNGLILDVRENGGGSSGTGYSILAYLTSEPFRDSQWSTRDYRPSYRAWGMPEKWYRGEAGTVQPRGPHPYTKPVAVLTSAGTFSAAEDFAVAFDSMKRGKIIGEPTGGSTGQPLSFGLPGGGSARVCTKHDRYPDGKEFVGVGVQPDILVRPTVADFRASRDTVLEAALKAIAAK